MIDANVDVKSPARDTEKGSTIKDLLASGLYDVSAAEFLASDNASVQVLIQYCK